MKHINKMSRSYELPAMADEKYNPNCLPLGYVGGIISGGGSIFEVARAVLYDQVCGLTKKVI
ncbi:hypothetical protein COX97_00195 [Candidatus Pacearchaeota archaeon CG_4_10_14_0_2_um_filter_05_32_18]|nr:MAG: hypothetical protein COX97_00195 [Candidatus Pacearchaeota archaeon CG_4_10_14_0_2_um_filter_05_32_18]